MKQKNIFIGLLFLIIGGFYLGSELNLIPYIQAWDVIISALALYFIFKSLPKREFITTCLSIGVLLIIGKGYVDSPILEQLTMWTILVSALIFGIGLQLIFKKKRTYDNNWEYKCDPEDNYQYTGERTEQSYQEDHDKIYATNKLGSMTKYVRTSEFRGGALQNDLGELVIDLTQAELSLDGAMLTVSCSLGETRILIPRHWAVRNEMTASLGHINDDRYGMFDATVPQLLIRGKVSMGEVKILYV